LEHLEAQFAEALSVHSALVGEEQFRRTIRKDWKTVTGLAERGPRAMEQLRQRIMDSAAGEPDSELFTQAAATIFKEMMGLDGSEVKMEMLRSALSHSVSGCLWSVFNPGSLTAKSSR
jgi:hypothetical protein